MISMFSPDKNRIVYCSPCWWSDDWDGREYAMDYDPFRPFLEQVKELEEKTPWQTLETQYLTLVNSDYTNNVGHIKNCYLTFWADYCENVFYSTFLNNLKDSLDCYRMLESELCYEAVGCEKCYRTFFSEECDSCTDVWFSRSCSGCTNCFGCINLRGKRYYIFNEPYSKEAYFEKLKEFNLDSRDGLAEAKERVKDFWLKYPRRAFIGNSMNVNVTGDYVYESKNAKDVYMVTSVEDSRYVQFVSVPSVKDSYDYSGWGAQVERIYEATVVGEGASQVLFSDECWPGALDNEYSMYAIACKHIFGCVNLKRKEYCILNKEYSKEEYEKLVVKIKEDMIKNPYKDSLGRSWPYGEFLPLDFSPFGYNETVAHHFFPKTKEEALKIGFKWHEGTTNQFDISKDSKDLPDRIADTDDLVLQEIVGCAECGKAFRFIEGELALMRRFNLPLPQSCSNCR
ncbi:MAG: hypothetical protein AAB903_01445 [Patescibacteria group bacterium]